MSAVAFALQDIDFLQPRNAFLRERFFYTARRQYAFNNGLNIVSGHAFEHAAVFNGFQLFLADFRAFFQEHFTGIGVHESFRQLLAFELPRPVGSGIGEHFGCRDLFQFLVTDHGAFGQNYFTRVRMNQRARQCLAEQTSLPA